MPCLLARETVVFEVKTKVILTAETEGCQQEGRRVGLAEVGDLRTRQNPSGPHSCSPHSSTEKPHLSCGHISTSPNQLIIDSW